ncbi:hypothetical protein ACFWF7_01375 [Nocardia sp. NPDC060256]|uniref:hypothetical protein n=1 Tax=unclassified Nocardia TaxID=2637762 RepID=UPI0036484541
MRVLSRVLATAAVGVSLAVLTPSTAYAADPPTAPKLCTPDQENAAAGDRDAVNACDQARSDSAKARYAGVPLSDNDKERSDPFTLKSEPGQKPRDRRDLYADSDDLSYVTFAERAAWVTCRFALTKGGELCKGPQKCEMIKQADLQDSCYRNEGGRPDDGVVRDDTKLPAELRAAKSTAQAAAAAGKGLKQTSSSDDYIKADKAEAAAVAAARELGWVA